nr:hypothetical protein [uncultured Chryseobacterium sp.]
MKLSLFDALFSKIYKSISFYGLEESASNRDRDLHIMINQYLSVIFIILIIQFSASMYLIGFTYHLIIILLTVAAITLIGLFLQRYIRNKYLTFSVFMYVIMLITYYSSLMGAESGYFLFYFSVFLAVHQFFSIKKDTVFVITIFAFTLICLYISVLNNFQLWGPYISEPYKNIAQRLLLINITCKIFLLAINYFFLEEKRNDYYNSLYRNSYKISQIDNLSTENKQLRKQISKKELSDKDLKDLLDSISFNDIQFLEKFEAAFPLFTKKLSDYTNASFSSSELTLCAILKLGLSTKEISMYTNSSLKAIEGRKYRLRKKFNISSDADLNLWFSNF